MPQQENDDTAEGLTPKSEAERILGLDYADRLFQLIRENRDGYVLLNIEGRILFCNSAFREMLGYSETEIREITYREITPEEWHDLDEKNFHKMLEFGRCDIYEKEYRNSDGRVFPIELSSCLIRDADDIPIGMWSIVRDLTDQRAALLREKESNRLFKRAQKMGKIAHYEYDLVTGTYCASDEAKLIYGYGLEREDFSYDDVWRCIPEKERVQQAWVDLIEEDKPYDLEHEIRPVSGPSSKTIRAVGEVSRDESGNPIKVFGLIQDITEQHQLKAQLLEAQKIAGVGRWELDLRNNSLHWSESIYELFEVDRASFEATYEAFLGFVHPDDREVLDSTFRQSMKNRSRYSVVHRLQMPEGRIKWVKEMGHTFYAEDGTPLRSVGVVLEVTDLKTAEETLTRSESLLKLTGRIAKVGGWEFDLSSGRPWLSQETLRIYELPLDHNMTIEEGSSYYHPDDQPKIMQAFKRAAEQGEPYDLEVRLISFKGTQKWVQTIGQAHFDDGKLIKLYGTIQDITERKHQELELQRQHKQLLDTQRIAHLGGWKLDIPTGRLEWTDETLRIFGIDAAAFDGTYEHYQDFVHPDDWSHTREAQRRAHEGQSNLEVEYRIVRPDGAVRHLYEQGELERDHEGRPTVLRGTVLDVTLLKEAQARAQAAIQRLVEFLDNSPLLVAEISSTHRYELANRALCQTLAHPPAEVIGKSFSELLEPDTAALFARRVDQVLETGEVIQLEDTLLLNEITSTFRSTLFPLFDAGGKPVSVGSIAEDITKQKAAEQEREALEEELRQSQKMEAIGRLAGGVAHDFNNMLSVIIGYTEMAVETLGPEHEITEDLRTVISSGKRSADLTRQLLAFARQQTIAPRVLNLNDIISEILKMLNRLVGENIQVRWHPGAELWDIEIDPTQIDQILANLAVNARDAIDDVGAITIETENVSLDEDYCRDQHGFTPGDYVVLDFSDDGQGMSRETQEKVFEPFFTTKPAGEGTGLGMSTVYGIVLQNEGMIHVYSQEGKGTTFRVYFPRVAGAESDTGQQSVDTALPSGTETILVVEDEESLLELTDRRLSRLGYQVLTASTVDKALELAESHRKTIAMMITDVVMPKMNGHQLYEKISEIIPGLPVLYLSGYTANVIANHGVLDPDVEFLSKPVPTQSLATKIRQMLDAQAV